MLTPEENVKKLRNSIKYQASNQGLTLKQLLILVAEKYNRNSDVTNYSGKIRGGTLSILQLYEILDILNLDIELKECK